VPTPKSSKIPDTHKSIQDTHKKPQQLRTSIKDTHDLAVLDRDTHLLQELARRLKSGGPD